MLMREGKSSFKLSPQTIAKYMATVTVGMPVKFINTRKVKSVQTKTVYGIEKDFVVLKGKTPSGMIKLTAVRPISFIYDWDWLGKPPHVDRVNKSKKEKNTKRRMLPLPLVPAEALSRRTPQDNISPMWTAIRDLQQRVAKLESDLGLPVGSNGDVKATH